MEGFQTLLEPDFSAFFKYSFPVPHDSTRRAGKTWPASERPGDGVFLLSPVISHLSQRKKAAISRMRERKLPVISADGERRKAGILKTGQTEESGDFATGKTGTFQG
jgi:hypothetical protein